MSAAQAADSTSRVRTTRAGRLSTVATAQISKTGAVASDEAGFAQFIQGRKQFKEKDAVLAKFVGECAGIVVDELPPEIAKKLNMYQDGELQKLRDLDGQKGIGARLKRGWLTVKRTVGLEKRQDPRSLSKAEALQVGNKAAVAVNKEFEARIQALTTSRIKVVNKIKWAEGELVAAKTDIGQMELAIIEVKADQQWIREQIGLIQAGEEMPAGSPTEAQFVEQMSMLDEELRDYAQQHESFTARRDALEEWIDTCKTFAENMRNEETANITSLDKSQLRTELQGTLAEGAGAIDSAQQIRDLANTIGVVNEAALGETINGTIENSEIIAQRETEAEGFVSASRQRWAGKMSQANDRADGRRAAIIAEIEARHGVQPETQTPTSRFRRP